MNPARGSLPTADCITVINSSRVLSTIYARTPFSSPLAPETAPSLGMWSCSFPFLHADQQLCESDVWPMAILPAHWSSGPFQEGSKPYPVNVTVIFNARTHLRGPFWHCSKSAERLDLSERCVLPILKALCSRAALNIYRSVP